jgi:hypothetical protein
MIMLYQSGPDDPILTQASRGSSSGLRSWISLVLRVPSLRRQRSLPVVTLPGLRHIRSVLRCPARNLTSPPGSIAKGLKRDRNVRMLGSRGPAGAPGVPQNPIPNPIDRRLQPHLTRRMEEATSPARREAKTRTKSPQRRSSIPTERFDRRILMFRAEGAAGFRRPSRAVVYRVEHGRRGPSAGD